MVLENRTAVCSRVPEVARELVPLPDNARTPFHRHSGLHLPFFQRPRRPAYFCLVETALDACKLGGIVPELLSNLLTLPNVFNHGHQPPTHALTPAPTPSHTIIYRHVVTSGCCRGAASLAALGSGRVFGSGRSAGYGVSVE